MCWHHPAMFCLITSSKLSRQWFEYSLKVKVMGLNVGNLLIIFLTLLHSLERCFCYSWEPAVSLLKITYNIHFKGLSQKSYLDDIRTFFKMPIPELFCSCSSANWRHAAGDIECKNLWNKSPVMSATALKGTHRFRKSTLFKEIK